MIIPIDEKRRIKGDSMAWQVEYRTQVKRKDVWTPRKYFRGFSNALRAVIEDDIRTHPAYGVAEAIQGVSDVIRRYNDMLPTGVRVEADGQ